MVSYYGRRQSTDTDVGLTGGTSASNQRFSVFGAMPEHGWGHTFYVLAGKPSGAATPTGRIALAALASGSPSKRMAYSNTLTFSGTMSYGGDGTLYSASIAFTDTGYGVDSSGVQMWSGVSYGLGFSATGAQLYHGMIAAANAGNNYSNNNLYTKDSSSVTPSEPLYTAAAYNGVMTIAIGYDPNVAPNVPVNRSPSGSLTTQTPTFTSTFSDGNTNRGDELNEYQIQLREVGLSTNKWDTTVNATASEKSNAATTLDYTGSTLQVGYSYEWRIRHRDMFDAWGGWSSWLGFSINGGGAVGQGSTPVGKQTTQTPGPFILPWSHASGLSTNAVQIRLVSGSTVVQTSPIITNTVLSGTSMSIAWATSGFTPLAWGSTLAYEARGRDTAGLWSDYGPNRTINTNAVPNQPTVTQPKNNVVQTTRPRFSGVVTDPDDAAPLSTVQCRIKNSAGAILFTRTMTLKAGSSSTYEYQTTATDLAAFGTYKWDMRAFDGFLYGAYSAEATFQYLQGPVVTVTAPTFNQVITTSTPTFTWTCPTQVTARVDIFDATSGAFIVGANITSAIFSWTVPAGYLKNGKSYTFTVTATDASQLTGNDSDPFSLVYATPSSVTSFLASALTIGGDDKPSIAFLSWAMAIDPTFDSYILRRRNLGTLAGDESEIILRRIDSISQVTFADTNIISGQGYTFSISKVITNGSDYLESLAVESSLTVQFDHVIISSATDGMSYRVSLYYMDSSKVDHKDDRTVFMPWGDEQPYIQFGPMDYDELKGTYKVISDRHGSALDAMNALRALKSRQIKLADVLTFRDGRGRRIFGAMSLSESDAEMLRYGVDIGFIEVAFEEGEA